MDKIILTESGWKKWKKHLKYRKKGGYRYVIKDGKHYEVDIDTSRQVGGYIPTPCNMHYL